MKEASGNQVTTIRLTIHQPTSTNTTVFPWRPWCEVFTDEVQILNQFLQNHHKLTILTYLVHKNWLKREENIFPQLIPHNRFTPVLT